MPITQTKSTRMNKQKKGTQSQLKKQRKPPHRLQTLNDLDIRINRQGLQRRYYKYVQVLKGKHNHVKHMHGRNLSSEIEAMKKTNGNSRTKKYI